MLKPFAILLSGLFLAACNRSSTLSPEKFTEMFAGEMRKSTPSLTITIAAPLELRIKDEKGGETTSFLDNAYNMYRGTPADRDEVIAKYIKAFNASRSDADAVIDRDRIVPVIKDKNYLAEIHKNLLERGQKAPNFLDLYEIYNSELWIFYAEDSPKNMRFLSKKDVETLQINTNSLRALAFENLRTIIPKVEIIGGNGMYMLRAGGDYEASLILSESLWTNAQFKVDGEIVVAVPARDLVIVTGSSDKGGIAKAREMAKKAAAEAPYRLTPELFVYRNGRFEVFRE